MKRLTPIFAFVLLLCGAGPAFAQGEVVVHLEVIPEDGRVLLRWNVDREDGVTGYDVHRKTPRSGSFLKINQAPIPPRGAGTTYEYVDASLFKGAADQQAEYYVEVTFEGGLAEKRSEIRLVNYTSTAVRRTWGSIKAMFQ